MTATTMHHDQVALTDEQFSKLVELLTPGYECSKLMLAELQARDAERQRYEAEREHGVPARTDAPNAPGNVDLPADPTVAGEPLPETNVDDHGED